MRSNSESLREQAPKVLKARPRLWLRYGASRQAQAFKIPNAGC